MPFGLCNAPATFQRLMEVVLRDLIGKCVYVYMDDICVFSHTVKEHFDHLEMVFERIRGAKLKLRKEKCDFMSAEVKYLGHILTTNGLMPQKDKIEAIASYKTPKTVKQLQSFLGLASYYRKFIKDFSKIASPLFRSTEKGKKFIWNQEQQQAFDLLKTTLTGDSILIYPNFSEIFRLETDASDIGLGSVLSQKRDGNWRPIAYWSRHLSRREQRFSTTEKEALAILDSIEHFKVYLYGQEFIVLTDHQPLKWLM